MENNNKYPDLFDVVLLTITYICLLGTCYLILREILKHIIYSGYVDVLSNGVAKIISTILIFIHFKKKNRSILSKKDFTYKNISNIQFATIIITSIGLILSLNELESIITNIIPLSESQIKFTNEVLLGGISLVGSII